MSMKLKSQSQQRRVARIRSRYGGISDVGACGTNSPLAVHAEVAQARGVARGLKARRFGGDEFGSLAEPCLTGRQARRSLAERSATGVAAIDERDANLVEVGLRQGDRRLGAGIASSANGRLVD